MTTYIAPYTGTAELTASTGLNIVEQNRWAFSQAGYNDGATFGVSLSWPPTQKAYDYGADTREADNLYGAGLPAKNRGAISGLLHLSAQNWTIADIGNELTAYESYGPERCQIVIAGRWVVVRQENSNSYNSFGTVHDGLTDTNLGSRPMQKPFLLNYDSPIAEYVIQGSAVTGGALDTFSAQEFWCKITESATSVNSNFEFQSNTIARPTWVYTYTKRWQID